MPSNDSMDYLEKTITALDLQDAQCGNLNGQTHSDHDHDIHDENFSESDNLSLSLKLNQQTLSFKSGGNVQRFHSPNGEDIPNDENVSDNLNSKSSVSSTRLYDMNLDLTNSLSLLSDDENQCANVNENLNLNLNTNREFQLASESSPGTVAGPDTSLVNNNMKGTSATTKISDVNHDSEFAGSSIPGPQDGILPNSLIRMRQNHHARTWDANDNLNSMSNLDCPNRRNHHGYNLDHDNHVNLNIDDLNVSDLKHYSCDNTPMPNGNGNSNHQIQNPNHIPVIQYNNHHESDTVAGTAARVHAPGPSSNFSYLNVTHLNQHNEAVLASGIRTPVNCHTPGVQSHRNSYVQMNNPNNININHCHTQSQSQCPSRRSCYLAPPGLQTPPNVTKDKIMQALHNIDNNIDNSCDIGGISSESTDREGRARAQTYDNAISSVQYHSMIATRTNMEEFDNHGGQTANPNTTNFSNPHSIHSNHHLDINVHPGTHPNSTYSNMNHGPNSIMSGPGVTGPGQGTHGNYQISQTAVNSPQNTYMNDLLKPDDIENFHLRQHEQISKSYDHIFMHGKNMNHDSNHINMNGSGGPGPQSNRLDPLAMQSSDNHHHLQPHHHPHHHNVTEIDHDNLQAPPPALSQTAMSYLPIPGSGISGGIDHHSHHSSPCVGGHGGALSPSGSSSRRNSTNMGNQNFHQNQRNVTGNHYDSSKCLTNPNQTKRNSKKYGHHSNNPSAYNSPLHTPTTKANSNRSRNVSPKSTPMFSVTPKFDNFNLSNDINNHTFSGNYNQNLNRMHTIQAELGNVQQQLAQITTIFSTSSGSMTTLEYADLVKNQTKLQTRQTELHQENLKILTMIQEYNQGGPNNAINNHASNNIGSANQASHSDHLNYSTGNSNQNQIQLPITPVATGHGNVSKSKRNPSASPVFSISVSQAVGDMSHTNSNMNSTTQNLNFNSHSNTHLNVNQNMNQTTGSRISVMSSDRTPSFGSNKNSMNNNASSSPTTATPTQSVPSSALIQTSTSSEIRPTKYPSFFGPTVACRPECRDHYKVEDLRKLLNDSPQSFKRLFKDQNGSKKCQDVISLLISVMRCSEGNLSICAEEVNGTKMDASAVNGESGAIGSLNQDGGKGQKGKGKKGMKQANNMNTITNVNDPNLFVPKGDLAPDSHFRSSLFQQECINNLDVLVSLVTDDIGSCSLLELSNDVFSNYIVQRLLDACAPALQNRICKALMGHAVQLSYEKYGCRVLQRAISALSGMLDHPGVGLASVEENKEGSIVLDSSTGKPRNSGVAKCPTTLAAAKLALEQNVNSESDNTMTNNTNMQNYSAEETSNLIANTCQKNPEIAGLAGKNNKVTANAYLLPSPWKQLGEKAKTLTEQDRIALNERNKILQDLVKELGPHIGELVCNQNGNHVVQRCFDSVEASNIVLPRMKNQLVLTATGVYGCRVLQRLIEHRGTFVLRPRLLKKKPPLSELEIYKKAGIESIDWMLDEMCGSSTSLLTLSFNQYGNYCLQYCLTYGRKKDFENIFNVVFDNLEAFCTHKFSSNITEKILDSYNADSDSTTVIGSSSEESHEAKILNKSASAGSAASTPSINATWQQEKIGLLVAKILNENYDISLTEEENNSNYKEAQAKLNASEKYQQERLSGDLTNPDLLLRITSNQYGNYIVQKVLHLLPHEKLDELLHRLRSNQAFLERSAYGKHILYAIRENGLFGQGGSQAEGGGPTPSQKPGANSNNHYSMLNQNQHQSKNGSKSGSNTNMPTQVQYNRFGNNGTSGSNNSLPNGTGGKNSNQNTNNNIYNSLNKQISPESNYNNSNGGSSGKGQGKKGKGKKGGKNKDHIQNLDFNSNMNQHNHNVHHQNQMQNHHIMNQSNVVNDYYNQMPNQPNHNVTTTSDQIHQNQNHHHLYKDQIHDINNSNPYAALNNNATVTNAAQGVGPATNWRADALYNNDNTMTVTSSDQGPGPGPNLSLTATNVNNWANLAEIHQQESEVQHHNLNHNHYDLNLNNLNDAYTVDASTSGDVNYQQHQNQGRNGGKKGGKKGKGKHLIQ